MFLIKYLSIFYEKPIPTFSPHFNLEQYSAQKINYSSDKKYQKIRLEVKYTTITKKSETQESEKVAFVQMPLATTKRLTYGALISDRK